MTTPRIRTHGGLFAAMEEEKNESTYFIPSLAIKEPIFHVPPLPHLTKVPPPVVRKPPVQGFDMRTLRRQVEALNSEIEEKEQTQSLLYEQNEQLWAYIQQLMQSNKANAQLMREEVLKLHSELRAAHQERYNIAEKLQLARNSKQMLLELNQELQGAQLTAEEVARRKQEAEESLLEAKEENAHLEQILRSQVEKMAGVNRELDEFRRRQLEEQALDLADDFFYTNKAVLRAAYYRFRSGVQKRFKLNRISEVLSRAFRWQLKTYYFRHWCGFLHRKHVMKRNQARRRKERLALCLQRWKVYAALERYFQRSRRKQLLKRVFTAWREDARESAYERWADRATKELHTLQFKRKMFQAWRKRTMFLGWNSPMVGLLEQEARVHHLKRLLRAWLRVSQESREELNARVRQVPGVVMWWHLTRWRELCESRWRRRGRLLRRFYRNLRRRVAERAEDAVTRRFAFSAWVAHRQRKALRRWQHYLRVRRMYISVPPTATTAAAGVSFLDTGVTRASYDTGLRTFSSDAYLDSPTQLLEHFATPSAHTTSATFTQTQTSALTAPSQPLLGALVGSLGHAIGSGLIGGRKIARHRRGRPFNRWQANRTQQVLSHMKLRWLRSTMLQWVVRATVLKRQRMCEAAGSQHHDSQAAQAALRRWAGVVRRRLQARREKRRYVLQTIVDGWRVYAAEVKAERRLKEGLKALEERVKTHRQARALAQWAGTVRRNRRLQHCADFLRSHLRRGTLQRTFSAWRGRFAKELYWKLRELSVEHSRMLALNELNRQTMEQLQLDREREAEQTQLLEQGVVSLQEQLSDAKISCREQERLIAEREVEKAEALRALEAAQQELRDALAEQEQMRAFEEILTRELQAQEAEKAQVQRAAMQAVEQAHAHTRSLRDEVATARAHAVHAERAAEAELLRGREEVEALQRQAEAVQSSIYDKRQTIVAMESEQSALMDGLNKVQYKLSEVARNGAALIAENEALIRAKGSANRIHKSNIGIKEARVRELQNLVHEFEQEQAQDKLRSHLQDDDSELQELIALQRQIEIEALRATGPVSVGTPAVGKGVSLYHNVLSPATALHAAPSPHPAGPAASGRMAVRPAAVRTSPVTAVSGGVSRSVGGPAARRSIRHDHSPAQQPGHQHHRSHVNRTPPTSREAVAAPTPRAQTPLSQARDLYSGKPSAVAAATEPTDHRAVIGGSIFDLLAPKPRRHGGSQSPPRHGHHQSGDDAAAHTSAAEPERSPARRVPSPRVYPMPVTTQESSPSAIGGGRLVNNFVRVDSSGPVRMTGGSTGGPTIQVPSAGLHSQPEGTAPLSSWSVRDGARFTPPASPSRAFPRSPPTFLTAALDTDSEDSEPASGPDHHQQQGQAGHGASLSLRSNSPESQAYSDHPADKVGDTEPAPHSARDGTYGDYYYHDGGDAVEMDEGSSFDGEGGAGGDEVDEGLFPEDSSDSGRSR